jgi:FMN phosphatase YigB (HAD superfamily)
MPLPALIFDFGNVIAFFDHGKVYERFAPLLGIETAALGALLAERGFLKLLIDFECGRITPTAFAEKTMAMAGLLIAYEEFVAGWNDIFWPNESLARLIPHLKRRGHPLILGSNTNILHSEHYCRQFAETLGHFDRLVFSHDVGVMKPAPAFYQACIEAAGVTAGSCVFIDDLSANVEAARRAGLNGHVYTTTPELVAALAQVGIEVPPGNW